MKKILFITLLLSRIAYGQIVITDMGSACVTTNASSFGNTGVTLDANALYLFIAGSTGTTNPGTITATTTTWTSVAAIGDATRRVQVFRYMGTSTVTGESVNLTNFGGGSTGYWYRLLKVTGVKTTGTNGADAIVQSSSATGAPGTNPKVTLPSAISDPLNGVIAFFINDVNPFAGTPASGFTELVDCGFNTPTTGGYLMYATSTTDNIPTVTRASSNYRGIAFELAAAPARRKIMIQ